MSNDKHFRITANVADKRERCKAIMEILDAVQQQLLVTSNDARMLHHYSNLITIPDTVQGIPTFLDPSVPTTKEEISLMIAMTLTDQALVLLREVKSEEVEKLAYSVTRHFLANLDTWVNDAQIEILMRARERTLKEIQETKKVGDNIVQFTGASNAVH
ncbi:MAG: hypothetical protein ACRCVV_21835 [Shewanella sp.]